MSNADRDAAQSRLDELIALVRRQPSNDHWTRLLDEAEALRRAIGAFHLEGIRFRMYNVDRLVAHSPTPLPAEANEMVADVHKHLEAAGFHTRSHQAP